MGYNKGRLTGLSKKRLKWLVCAQSVVWTQQIEQVQVVDRSPNCFVLPLRRSSFQENGRRRRRRRREDLEVRDEPACVRTMKEEREIEMLLSATAFLFEEKNFLLHCTYIGLSSAFLFFSNSLKHRKSASPRDTTSIDYSAFRCEHNPPSAPGGGNSLFALPLPRKKMKRNSQTYQQDRI